MKKLIIIMFFLGAFVLGGQNINNIMYIEVGQSLVNIQSIDWPWLY